MSPEVHLEGHVVSSRNRRSTSHSDAAPRATHALTLFLSLLASNVLAIAKADGEFSMLWWAVRVVEGILVLGAAAYFARRSTAAGFVSPLLVVVVASSLSWEPVQRSLLDRGRPFEVIVMDALRLMTLGLAAAACRVSHQRLAAGCSLFLVMFGAVLSFTPLVHVLVGVYAAGALGWMAATYWDSLRSQLVAHESRSQPRWGVIAIATLLGAGAIAVGATNRSAVVTLRGFIPSSGGNRDNDPHARSGVGDGDLLVAGVDNIQSFAPIEDAPFVDDHRPGLYDVINEVSGEPRKISPRSGLRVAVPQELAAKLKQHLHTQSEKAAREFSTLRRTTPPKQRKIKDIRSNALLYVAGRTPLHLRMQTYAVFDGVDWLPEVVVEPHRLPELRMVTVDERPWLQLDDQRRWSPYLAEAETHAIKPVRLGSASIPAPLHVHGIHIDMVDRIDFFEWAAGGVVRMKRDELPPGVAIHLASRSVDTSRLVAKPQEASWLRLNDDYNWLPESAAPERLRSLADQWTQHVPRGWLEVQAIVDRLRADYALDGTVELGSDNRSAVLDFLFETRRGPDYQFATATALLLRSLGYSTRLVSGFYASSERYDAHLRHTPVLTEDLHFWVEVHTTAGQWLTVEPTPGYSVLDPPPDLWTRGLAAATAASDWVRAHAMLTVTVLCLIGVLAHFRASVRDFFVTLLWRLRPDTPERERVLATWRLIEGRMESCDLTRPSGSTIRDWIAGWNPAERPLRPLVWHFLSLVEWAAFAPTESSPPLDGVQIECDRLVRTCTLRNFHNPNRVTTLIPRKESSSHVTAVSTLGQSLLRR
ncbi:MAG: transglutaminase-like domain-containing protein [Planctomycetaceae bacterium]